MQRGRLGKSPASTRSPSLRWVGHRTRPADFGYSTGQEGFGRAVGAARWRLCPLGMPLHLAGAQTPTIA